MGRKNNRASGRGKPQRPKSLPPWAGNTSRVGPKPPIEKLVVPRGRCGRAQKIILPTEDEAKKALDQAVRRRERSGVGGRTEKRYYECPKGGHYHLTGRDYEGD